MTMSLERRQEIALMAMRYMLKKNGLPSLDTGWVYESMSRAATGMGIGFDEAYEFFETLVRELVDEAFESSAIERPQRQDADVCEGRR